MEKKTPQAQNMQTSQRPGFKPRTRLLWDSVTPCLNPNRAEQAEQFKMLIDLLLSIHALGGSKMKVHTSCLKCPGPVRAFDNTVWQWCQSYPWSWLANLIGKCCSVSWWRVTQWARAPGKNRDNEISAQKSEFSDLSAFNIPLTVQLLYYHIMPHSLRQIQLFKLTFHQIWLVILCSFIS